jgi:hypothetical protein
VLEMRLATRGSRSLTRSYAAQQISVVPAMWHGPDGRLGLVPEVWLHDNVPGNSADAHGRTRLSSLSEMRDAADA